MVQSDILAGHLDLEENCKEDLQVLTLRSHLREALGTRRTRSEDAQRAVTYLPGQEDQARDENSRKGHPCSLEGSTLRYEGWRA